MRDTLIYLFILILIFSLPNVIEVFRKGQLLAHGDVRSLFILQGIIIYPMYIILAGVMGISLLAVGGVLIKKVMKRKLTYHHMWKMTVFSSTNALLLSTIEKLFGVSHMWIDLLLVLLLYFYLYKMIIVYPPVPNK